MRVPSKRRYPKTPSIRIAPRIKDWVERKQTEKAAQASLEMRNGAKVPGMPGCVYDTYESQEIYCPHFKA